MILPPPKPRNPLLNLREPKRPPANRSREAHGLVAAAATGKFELQQCRSCGVVHYPPQQVCRSCLSDDLQWTEVHNGGVLMAETTLHHSNDLYFRDRLPWRLGMVRMDAGPSVVAHLSAQCERGQRVRLNLELDRSGFAAMSATPQSKEGAVDDDMQLREMAVPIKGRRVLIVDGMTPLGLQLAKAFKAAGARAVYAGCAQPWRASGSLVALDALDGVERFPLDVTDTDSVTELGAVLGGKVDILVNNSYYLRSGGALGRMDLNTTRDEMDVHYFGALRLAGAFGPAMRARSADGDYGAVAWINVLSIYALVNNPVFGTYSASQAAALSMSHCLRAELGAAGVRVVNAYLGPLDDEWHQQVPPPKLEAPVAARRIVSAVQRGGEDLPIGAIAEDILGRYLENPKEIERAIRF